MDDPWLGENMQDLGGEYKDYYKRSMKQLGKKKMCSAGLLGGDREIMLSFLAHYMAVLTDPNIAMNQKGSGTPRSDWGFQNINMPALNYVAERFYAKQTHGGKPFNSDYRKFQTSRTDCWFIHK